MDEQEPQTVSALIVERSPRLAIAMAQVLESSRLVKVVGRVDNPLHLLEVVRELRPDVVLLDADRPGCPLVEVCRELSDLYGVGVVLLAAEASSRPVHEALAAQARCIIARPFKPRELILGVVHAGMFAKSTSGLSALPEVESWMRADNNLSTGRLAPIVDWASRPAVGEISPRLRTRLD